VSVEGRRNETDVSLQQVKEKEAIFKEAERELLTQFE
jgi:hypothetical protein